MPTTCCAGGPADGVRRPVPGFDDDEDPVEKEKQEKAEAEEKAKQAEEEQKKAEAHKKAVADSDSIFSIGMPELFSQARRRHKNGSCRGLSRAALLVSSPRPVTSANRTSAWSWACVPAAAR